MALRYELFITSRIHEDYSGVAPPPRSMLFVDDVELIEYVRESYSRYPEFFSMSDSDLAALMSADGVRLPLSKGTWDELRFSMREMP